MNDVSTRTWDYTAFSISQSNFNGFIDDLERQDEHLQRYSFQDEFRELCRKHRIELDDRYVED